MNLNTEFYCIGMVLASSTHFPRSVVERRNLRTFRYDTVRRDRSSADRSSGGSALALRSMKARRGFPHDEALYRALKVVRTRIDQSVCSSPCQKMETDRSVALA